ncbi:dienelactone hydrolase family protein [Frateuria aurantia]
MGTLIQLTAGTDQLSAYLARPEGQPKGAVVVVQEIFGLNAHIRDVVDRYADAGYLAIAPALFDPIQPGVELDYTAEGVAAGLEYVGQLGFDRPLAAIAAAAQEVAAAGKVGVVGYCWGGSLAYLAAIKLALPAVSYYGGRNTLFTDQAAQAPLMFHYGEHDAHISAADRAQVQQANPDAPVYVYDADHGFNCDRRGSYNEAAAKLAQQRTLEFFARHLGA